LKNNIFYIFAFCMEIKREESVNEKMKSSHQQSFPSKS